MANLSISTHFDGFEKGGDIAGSEATGVLFSYDANGAAEVVGLDIFCPGDPGRISYGSGFSACPCMFTAVAAAW
jgi:hypothetical protein